MLKSPEGCHNPEAHSRVGEFVGLFEIGWRVVGLELVGRDVGLADGLVLGDDEGEPEGLDEIGEDEGLALG